MSVTNSTATTTAQEKPIGSSDYEGYKTKNQEKFDNYALMSQDDSDA
jgi:hypothetical protein